MRKKKEYSIMLSLKERKCPVCGKIFIIQNPLDYVYKRKPKTTTKFFCSWGCMRAWDKEHPLPKKQIAEF